MSEASAELAELLAELRATEGRIARGKILLNGGRILKGMSTEERIRVAYTLGVDNVGDLLHKMDQDALTDEDIGKLVQRAEELDPVEVGALIRDLDDPAARKEAVHGLVDEFVTDPRGEQPSPHVGTSAPVDEVAPAPPVAVEPAPSAAVEPAVPVEVAPPAPVVDSALADALAVIPSAIAQLRALRTRTDEAAELSVAQLRHLLRAFPAGWRRRKAISALFADGVPSRFQDALALLGELETEADWIWAASSLVRDRELASAAFSQLLRAAPSDYARKRIAMRAS